MAKVSRVNVLCLNGKRQILNLTPNSSILQILEQVCEKQNLNPDDFDICHYNKPMDLTLPARFANLSNNAQLELQPVKVPRKKCLVTVGLQLESGERIMKDFVPSTSVWDVVEECLKNRIDKSNVNEKGEPVCIYMRQKQSKAKPKQCPTCWFKKRNGAVKFFFCVGHKGADGYQCVKSWKTTKLVGQSMKDTTLHGLGLTKGSVVFRLMYRNPEDLVDQAHSSTPLSKPKEVAPAPSLKSAFHGIKSDKRVNENIQNARVAPKLESDEISLVCEKREHPKDDISVPTNKENIEEGFINKDELSSDLNTNNNSDKLHVSNQMNESLVEQNMELDYVHDIEKPSEVEDIGTIHYLGDRNAVLYSLNDITDVKKADLPDEYFKLTIDDVKYLMEQFKKNRVALENQPLLTKELRNRQLLQQLGRFKQTVIRIYFPERLVLQAVFEAQETVQDICNFIRDYLEDKEVDFYLYTTPPKERKDPSKTLIESMLIPAAVMYFGCDKHDSTYLLETLNEKVSDPRAASLAAHKARKEVLSEIEDTPSNDTTGIVVTYLSDANADSYKVPAANSTQVTSPVQTTGKVPKWFKASK